MLGLSRTEQFKRDLKKALKDPRRDTTKLKTVIAMPQQEMPLPVRYLDHLLKGNWKPHRECHIHSDFLLIYRIEGGVLVLVRCGSHAELFG